MPHPVYLHNRYERVVSVFSRAGFPTEHLRADFISEKVAGIDVTRTMQPRFGAAAAAASADVTALLNDSDFDESKEQAEDPSGISPADLSDWAPDEEEEEAIYDLAEEMLSDDFPPPPEAAATRPAAALKAEKILSAIATSFPKNANDAAHSPQQQPKKLAPRQTPVPKTPRLMPMPSVQAHTPKQPRVASTAAALKVDPPSLHKGPSIKYVRKFFGFLDPLPPESANSFNFPY